MRESFETLAVSSDDLKKLGGALQIYLDNASATWAILVTRSGQMLAQRGFLSTYDLIAIAALTGGIFNSTVALAELLGESSFTEFLQEGKKSSLFYLLLKGDFFLVSLYDDRTLPGVIKTASERFAVDVEKVLWRILEQVGKQ